MSTIYYPADNPVSNRVGAKAYNLSLLFRYGQKIPASLFIAVEVLRDFITHNNLQGAYDDLKRNLQTYTTLNDCEKAAGTFRNAILKGEIQEDFITELNNKLSDRFEDTGTKVAVRSSSINEDLQQHSFAGQYESILNSSVSVNDLIDNIKKVWASQWSNPIIAYIYKHSLQLPGPEMGVIIQKMVPAEIAGVLFSQNPYNFNKDEMIVEYVQGLGEALVSGEKTPIHLVYHRSTRNYNDINNEIKKEYEKPLNQLVLKAHDLEKKTGFAIDVEWAYAENELYLLQMRSITSVAKDITLWTDENVGEVIPDIVTPFSWSILNPITNNAFKGFLHGLGIHDYPSQGLFGLYKGKVYFNNTAFQSTLNRFYISAYVNAIKEKKENKLKIILKLAILPINLGLALFNFLRFSHKLPAKIIQHFDLHRTILDKNNYKNNIGPNDSFNHTKQILDLHQHTMFLHLSDTILAELYYQFFRKICEMWIVKKTGINADQLLTGLDEAESVKSGEALWRLSNAIREKNLKQVFNENDVSAVDKKLNKSESGKTILLAIDDFIDQFGYSALHEFELLYPRWWEDRSYIYSNLRNYLNNDYVDMVNQKKERLEKHAHNFQIAIHSLSGVKRWLFKYFYNKTSFFSSQRENLKQAFIKAHSELKKHLLNMGVLLVKTGILTNNDDILFLELNEIQEWIKNSSQENDFKEEIKNRRKQRLQFDTEEHPPKLIQAGDIWRPVYDTTENVSGALRGIGCSSGIVEGTARVIISENQFENLHDGDILITKSTNPGWTPLFVTAAAIVTEIGGALSHGAIIAREYGIPMISAVKDITQIVSSGDRIKINGDSGMVEILSKTGERQI